MDHTCDYALSTYNDGDLQVCGKPARFSLYDSIRQCERWFCAEHYDRKMDVEKCIKEIEQLGKLV
jgi:hypothetical protein